MIDVDEFLDSITEDMVHEVLNEINKDGAKEVAALIPEDSELAHELVNAIVTRMVYTVSESLDPDPSDKVGQCLCLIPLSNDSLRRGYCHNCFRPIELSIERNPLERRI